MDVITDAKLMGSPYHTDILASGVVRGRNGWLEGEDVEAMFQNFLERGNFQQGMMRVTKADHKEWTIEEFISKRA